MAELPEDYRVVAVERRAALARKRTVDIIRIHQHGRLTAATIVGQAQAGHGFASEQLPNKRGDASWHESS